MRKGKDERYEDTRRENSLGKGRREGKKGEEKRVSHERKEYMRQT